MYIDWRFIPIEKLQTSQLSTEVRILIAKENKNSEIVWLIQTWYGFMRQLN